MLAVRDVAGSGSRSLHAIRFPLGSLSVFIGANGVGKTNLYRALEYLQSAATDTLIRNLVAEGSLDSVNWAGARKAHESARIRWSVELADDVSGLAYDYAVEVGCKPPAAAAGFPLEPELKTERLRLISARRPATLLHRDGPGGFLRDGEGRKRSLGGDLLPSETVLGTVQDGGSYPDLHPDLLAPLARLIVKASARTQVWLVTHSERLADAILAEGGTRPHRVIQREGATWIEGLKLFGAFAEDD
jgi:predicted ATPase